MGRRLLEGCAIVGLGCVWAATAAAQVGTPGGDARGYITLINSVVIVITLLLGVAGFLRSTEQTRDASFRDVTSRLGDQSSAVIRAAAAGQLPHFFRYRRYFLLARPYPGQVLHLLLHALKKEKDVDVRQMLFNSLAAITGNAPLRDVARAVGTADLGRGIDLVRANLDEIIMDGFNFTDIDLTDASIQRSSLHGAQFVAANLWKAKLCHSDLEEADLTDASIWDTDLSHANLQKAKLLMDKNKVNANTSLRQADLLGAQWSAAIDPREMGAGRW